MRKKNLDRLIALDVQAKGLLHGTTTARDRAPDDLKVVARKMMATLKSKKCSVITPKRAAYTAGNSLVYCGPDIAMWELFPANGRILVAATIVVIYGNLKEELHYHSSHVISFVLEGEGFLYTEDGKLEAKPGDLVTIPRGIKHLFNCEDGKRMLVFATEISDEPIDHQKNWY
ncbi:MAG: cupin domain-containing protein [Candidatus Pacebacteria bacterium]|nr:cupin domain-containing protein [Candidatus Paceibacterota bacterium]MDD5356795.1 cupin domain-containing protein [Candidatus Paceibacterota bacterium]